MVRLSRPAKTFTPKQGQYLAFIHLYARLHRRPPAETDMQQYFRVSPPSVHQMVLTLELVARVCIGAPSSLGFCRARAGMRTRSRRAS
jgi:hypothetical protein